MGVNSGEYPIPPDGLENLEGLYDGEIAFSDHALGIIARGLRDRGLEGSTVIFVLADHGEEFMEHGMVEHGNNLFNESLHVPLVACGPGIPAGAVDSILCSHIDIFPTIAGLCGIDPPEGLPGCDLLAGGPPVDRWVPSSGILWRETDMACVTDGSRKIVWDPADASAVLYDLRSDPGETIPLRPDSNETAEVLYYWSSPQAGHPAAVNFGETVRSTLRDLGYIR
jgi:arylsulfatase A-like enzyme